MPKVNIDTVAISAQANLEVLNIPSTIVRIISVEGEVKDSYQNRYEFKGKQGLHNLNVRTMKSGKILTIEGSYYAARFGQNLITTKKMKSMCSFTIDEVVNEMNLNISMETLDKWKKGDVVIDRVDLAVNYRFSSSQEVENVITQIKRQLIESNVRVLVMDSSVIWQPKNKEYSISFYDKGKEVRRHSRYINQPWRHQYIDECDKILRIEVRVQKSGLIKRSLSNPAAWTDASPEMVFDHYLKKLPKLSIASHNIYYKSLDKLPNRLKPIWMLKKMNVDVNKVFSQRTLQRHKSDLGKLGWKLTSKASPNIKIESLSELLARGEIVLKPPAWMKAMNLVYVKAD